RAAPALGEVERALHRVPDLVPEHRAEQPVAVADAAIERRARDPDLGGQRLHVEAAAPEVGGVGGFEDGRRYVGRRLRALRNQLGEGLHAALGDGSSSSPGSSASSRTGLDSAFSWIARIACSSGSFASTSWMSASTSGSSWPKSSSSERSAVCTILSCGGVSSR